MPEFRVVFLGLIAIGLIVLPSVMILRMPPRAESRLAARAKAMTSNGSGNGTLGNISSHRVFSTARHAAQARLIRAGIRLSVFSYWAIHVLIAIFCASLFWLSGLDSLPPLFGVKVNTRIGLTVAVALLGGIGLPRVATDLLIRKRRDTLLEQFANGVDIIVRGVRAGLPLTECLHVIAAEGPAPINREFQRLTDTLAIGTAFEQALEDFYQRVLLPEVRFFMIVLVVQSKSGGNLAEALQNLSSVIRKRRMMQKKIKALSAEARISAIIIGVLPALVGMLVYAVTPDYILTLFQSPAGHSFLFYSGSLIIIGTLIMRQMIDFKF